MSTVRRSTYYSDPRFPYDPLEVHRRYMSKPFLSPPTFKEPKPFAGHHEGIHTVCYSPDGKQIATRGSEPRIRIWDSDTGEMSFQPERYATSVCYSPDGNRLLSGHSDGTICMWDASGGEIVVRRVDPYYAAVTTIICSPDNRHIASGGVDSKLMQIWCAEDLTWMIEIRHPGNVTSVSFSPDGNHLATGCKDKRVRIFDVETGMLVIGPLEGHAGEITAVTYSPDGEQLASCSADETIRIWDASTGSALLDPLEGHFGRVTCVVYSPDGRHLVSGSLDRTIRLWDSQTGQLIGGPVKRHNGGVTAISFAPDGGRFVTGARDGSMRVWEARTLQVLSPELTEDEKDWFQLTGPFRGHLAGITAVAYFPDGDRIASASNDGTIRIWDVQTGKEVAGPFIDHRDPVISIATSADGSRLVGGGGTMIRVWDTRTGDVILGPLKGDPVGCVRFSPDDQLIASTGDSRVLLWDSVTGEQLRSMDGGTPIYTLDFSPDGSRLATAGFDDNIRVWDVSTFELIAGPFRGHNGIVHSVAFSPDGLYIVSGSLDETVRIWDAKTGTIILGPLRWQHSGPVASVSYSPDGMWICSTYYDRTICIWNAKTGDLLLGPLEGHLGEIYSAAFSPDGKQIVTGSEDWTIKFWDTATGGVIRFPDTRDDQSGLSFLDMPATRPVVLTQPIQEIGLGSILDLPGTTRPQDFSVTVADSVRGDRAAPSAFFSFSRLHRMITNTFHYSRSTSDAVELQERRHRWVSGPIRTAYARTKSFVVIASMTPPREQALRDVSDAGTASDGGGSARQRTEGEENVANTETTNAATGEAAQRQSQHGPPSMQASAPYVAPSSSEAPRVYFAPGSVESEDSFEADCCACCPRWCTCLHP